ncbi:MAG: aminoglycoside phosphotransferase family protein [Cyanobacteriota bacterium]|nr:aminoglycoside phosphotransferase family protein [Cyanobacteriota bacterium]
MIILLSSINQIFNRFFQRWKSHFYAILSHPTEAKILMLSDDENSWFLPNSCVNKGIHPSNFATIQQVIEQELGISANILYYAHNDNDKSKCEIQTIYVLEHNCLGKELIEKFKDASWVDLETLKNISLKLPEHKSVIQEYLTEIESNEIPELRPPWARKGWFDHATKWIEEQLLELNYQQLSPVVCIKNWGISCVLRVNTTAGNIYFKQASRLPLFCNEPLVTTELANLFPENIPTVLSINSEHHWMLLADFGEPIGRNSSIKLQKDIYRLLAQIQIKSIQHIDNLLSIGCLDRRLEKLSTQIDVLFNDKNVLDQLKEIEIKQLRTLVPHLKNLCSQLAEYKIPQTLIHGDLHLGNVALHNNKYLIFDWTDGCISHPFFDMFPLFFIQNKNPFFSPLRNLRDEYLSQWKIYESKPRLLEAWKLAKPLCALHHAITYQHITACLEPRAKQECNALPYFLRQLLKCKI